jgi:non-heme chloroperoxidase
MEATDAKENVTLVGFSMGGGEVARYTSRYQSAAAMIEDVTLLEYPGSPHGLLETDRDQIVADLLAFLNGDVPAARDSNAFVINPALPMGSY